MSSTDELVAHANAGVKILLGRTNASDIWTLRLSVPSARLQVFDTSTPGTSCKLYKAVIEVPYDLNTNFAVFLDLKSRLKWDSNIAGLETTLVAALSQSSDFQLCGGKPNYLILHSATKPVGPISGRDFTDCIYLGPISALPPDVAQCAPATLGSSAAGSAKCLVNGGAGLAQGHAAFPETSAFVRGFNFSGSGWVLEPIAGPTDTSSSAPAVPTNANGWTRIYYVVQSDLKGWLPTAVVNSSMVNMFQTFFANFLHHMSHQAFSTPGSK